MTRRRYEVPAQVVRGFCMGAADVVPGVSGGTIALVFGIYERLVHAVRGGARALGRLGRLDGPGARRALAQVDWLFVVPLLAGIGLAVVTLAGFIDHQLETNPVETVSVFFGLVVGSVVVALDQLRHRDPPRTMIMVVTAGVTFVALGYRGASVADPTLLTIGAAGALAITAMILPGISGSFILLLLGLYETVLDAVDARDLGIVLSFGVGAVIGLALFSTVLDWLLRHHHDSMLAALIGLMVGSLRVLWPWPAGTDETGLGAPGDEWVLALVVAVAACGAVMGLSGLSSRVAR